MLVIPSIDLQAGRSRIVHWPGAASGEGAPTDRPERIADAFVRQGARLIHLVDVDGARAGRPVNLEPIGAIASRVAVPLQVAGGLESAEAIRLAFAAGATRVVLSMAVADDAATLRGCQAVAGDWLAVGLDPRPDRLEAFPWTRARPSSVEVLADELAAAGVARFVVSHGDSDAGRSLIAHLVGRLDADVLVAGGVTDLPGLARLRELGVSGVILGEALLSGAIDFTHAMEAAA
ncbi:MAG TPA: HisA/HisF-related TIM barrel protein [Candidatus Limnocylindrales bacterium]